jgi:protein SCO1
MTDVSSRGLSRIRLILWVLVAIAAIGATLIFFFRPPAAPLAVTGTPFTLQSTAGGTFTETDLVGKPSLVFFGYTNCPDVCPTALAESVKWKTDLGLSDDQLRTIFVTVDPERDTLETVKAYLGGFDPDVIGLVGDAEQTTAVKAAFGAASELGEKRDDGFYLVSHTASMFLIDRNGRFQGLIDYAEATDSALGKIRRLIGI